LAWIRPPKTLGNNNYLGFLALFVDSRIKLIILCTLMADVPKIIVKARMIG
jgi:hypothetical protein